MDIKLHKPIIRSIVTILTEVFDQGKYVDRSLEYVFKNNKQLGARDRATIAETVYDIVRYYRLYQYCTKGKNNYWELIACYFILKKYELPEFTEWQMVDETYVESQYQEAIKHRVLKESIPDWLDELGQQELQSQWPEILTNLNQKANLIIRTNTLKIDTPTLRKKLKEENIPYAEIENQSDATLLLKKNIYQSSLFKDGFFEVQDGASQLVAPFLQVESGMRVIDACAGAGGKSLHIASLMKNKGYLISLDTEKWKLEELRKRFRRNGISIIEPRWIENNKVIKRLVNSCDRLLLDVPCSGLGVVKRNPDAKWKLTVEFIQQIKKTQQEILQQYSKMLRSGGKMVYATCSILPSENQNQITHFLNNNPDFKLEEDRIILPDREAHDGFYMARLVKQ